MTHGKSRKEDLERAAELAVEKVAERVAERAVEKALESGNTTTETKTVRQSYSNVRKEIPRENPEDYDEEYVSKEIEESEEDNGNPWKSYPHPDIWSSKLELGDIYGDWRRFPRSDGSGEEDQIPKNYHRNYHKPLTTVTRKHIPLSRKSEEKSAQKIIPQFFTEFQDEKIVSSEKKLPYSFYEHLRSPSVKVPVIRPYLEKKLLYPMKDLVNVPVQVSQSQQIEKLVSDEVKVDRARPYKVEVPVSRPYTIEKRIPVEDSKVSGSSQDQTYPVQAPKPYFLYVIKSYAVPIKSFPHQLINNPINIPIDKSYQLKIPEQRSYIVRENQAIPFPVPKPYPFIVQMPIPTQIKWDIAENTEINNKLQKDLEESETTIGNNAKWHNLRNEIYKFH